MKSSHPNQLWAISKHSRARLTQSQDLVRVLEDLNQIMFQVFQFRFRRWITQADLTSQTPIQGTLGKLQDFSLSLHEPGRAVTNGSNGRFAFIFHDPTVVLLDECLSFCQFYADLQGSYIIHNIYSGSWNKIRCLFIGIHEVLGSLASSSDHWRTCKFASHSHVSTMSFTDRSSNQVQALQSPWIPVHPLSLDLNPSGIFICYGIQLPILALSHPKQRLRKLTCRLGVPLQWKVLAVVDMIATMLQWRVSYRSI